MYRYTLSIEASWTFPIDIPGYGTVDVPLPPAIHARNWYPIFSSVEYSCLSQQFLLLKTSKNRRNNRIDFFSSNYFRRTSNRHSFSKFRRPHHQFAFDVSSRAVGYNYLNSNSQNLSPIAMHLVSSICKGLCWKISLRKAVRQPFV